jgi:hypothetical protein
LKVAPLVAGMVAGAMASTSCPMRCALGESAELFARVVKSHWRARNSFSISIEVHHLADLSVVYL